MRVLYFMNHVDHGGAALALYDLVKEIHDNYPDIEPIVITGRKNRLNDRLSEIGVENYTASFKNFISTSHKPENVWRLLYFVRYYTNRNKAVRRIEKYVDFNTVDIIHSNLNRIDIGVIMAKKYNVPHIWHIREYGQEGFKLLSFKQKPVDYMNSFNSNVIFISKAIKDHWIKEGLKSDLSAVIYDGIREELYADSPKSGERKVIKGLFLGGYCKLKGQLELIEALGQLDDTARNSMKVDFYGKGDARYINKLIKRVRKLHLEKVIQINGYDENVWTKVPDYDIGFNCSESEGFGRVTVEYMLSGLCPIVSDSGANTELVENGRTGLVYQKGNVEELKQCLQLVLSDHTFIYMVKRNARESALKRFTMKRHTFEIINLYKRILLQKCIKAVEN